MHNAFRNAEYLVDNHCMYGFQNWVEDKSDAFAAENRNRAMAMLLEKNYLEVKKLLAEHRVLLDKMTAEALSKTTLVLKDIQKIMNENTDRKGSAIIN